MSNTEQNQPEQQPQPQQDENDFPLGDACDLSGDEPCEACQ